MKLLLVFCIFFVLKSSSLAEEDCTKILNRIDSLFRTAMLLKKPLIIPNTEERFEEYCKSAKKLPKALTSYNKCIKPLHKQILGLLIASTKKSYKKDCELQRQETLQSYQCLDETFLTKVFKSTSLLVDNLRMAATTPPDAALPVVCCSLHKFYSNVDKIPELPCENPNINRKDFVITSVSKLLSDSWDLLCGSYPSAEVCQEKEAKLWTDMNNGNPNLDLSHESVFQAFIDAIHRISE